MSLNDNRSPLRGCMGRLLYLLRFYAFTVVLFMTAKVVFMFCHRVENVFSFSDVLNVLWHGLTLDLSTSLYLFVLPFLCIVVSFWMRRWNHIRTILKCYYALVAVALSLAFVADTSLYSFWGFKLDASVFQYVDQTGNAFTSVSIGYLFVRLLLILLLSFIIYKVYVWLTPRTLPPSSFTSSSFSARQRGIAWGGYFLGVCAALAAIVIGIRGGLSVSTTNVGQVYFSQQQFLNHSAVNPFFSFLASFGKSTADVPEYRFFSEEECRQHLRGVFFTDGHPTDTLLRTQRPNIILIVMESCGGEFTEIGGRPEVTPNLTRLARESVYFTECYANSWRTDRGLVSILSGWPAFPKTSVMKMPSKVRTLPSLARSLGRHGYASTFIYGGDIDFTNTRGYLLDTGTQTIISEDDFTAAQRGSSKWGVCDSIAFDRLYEEAILEVQAPHTAPEGKAPHTAPEGASALVEAAGNDTSQFSVLSSQLANPSGASFITLLTLSSHEPWTVPMPTKFEDEVLNSFYYLDLCLGRFIERLRQSPQWDNTLVIILPDHGIKYQDIDETTPLRSHIPMLWTGGAIKGPRRIDTFCTQSDLAATLLSQLGISHDDYPFSRDIFSPLYVRPFAMHTHSDGFAVIDSTGFHAYDLNSQRVVKGKNDSSVRIGKAILQLTASDLRSR